jgi:hypothetical protein
LKCIGKKNYKIFAFGSDLLYKFKDMSIPPGETMLPLFL